MMRVTRLVRRTAEEAANADGAIVIDVRGLRVTIGRGADVCLVAMVVAIVVAGARR